MSRGHYDCFYGWEDLESMAQNIRLLREVAADFDEKGMHEAAEKVRGAYQMLRGLEQMWNDSPVPKLCRALDWNMSCDTGEDTMRERVEEILHGKK